MEPWHLDDQATIYHGDCLEVLRELPDASVDSVVTDPPYGLEFMGKDWDAPWKASGDVEVASEGTAQSHPFRDGSSRVRYGIGDMPGFQTWCELWAAQCLRVLKPGGHLLAFGGTRTWHRLAVAIEDAGFEIRDSIAWMYGSGFPKSLDVSKAIDKAAGAERQLPRSAYSDGSKHNPLGTLTGKKTATSWCLACGKSRGSQAANCQCDTRGAPATPDAARWQGWGTALKPAHEPVVVARKPLTGTVAANVLEHGTGALNIDGCRIGFASDADESESKTKNRHADFGTPSGGNAVYGDFSMVPRANYDPSGRWPANVVLDEDQAAALDRQSGTVRSSGVYPGDGITSANPSTWATNFGGKPRPASMYADSGGASRFFYVAKAPARERPKVDGIAHPTVKPLTLMRWLCRLVTPPGGTVLEPFAGSGTTIEAALLEGFRVVAIEREPDYLPLIAARLERIGQEPDGQLTLDASA